MSKEPEQAQEPKPLAEHLIELRKRLLWAIAMMVIGTAAAFVFVEQIYGFLVEPLARAMGPQDSQRLIYTGLTEAFFTYVKVAFFAGIFITFPVLLLQVWKFIAPGLYGNEKRAFLPFLVATPALFFLGGACVYYVVLPTAWPFFLSFQTGGGGDQFTDPIRSTGERISGFDHDADLCLWLVFPIARAVDFDG